jgi:hypothetical protein
MREVLAPCVEDFIAFFLHYPLCLRELIRRHTVIIVQFDDGFQPKLGFPVGTMHMNVRPFFLTRKEEKPIFLPPEDGRAHESILLPLII